MYIYLCFSIIETNPETRFIDNIDSDLPIYVVLLFRQERTKKCCVEIAKCYFSVVLLKNRFKYV